MSVKVVAAIHSMNKRGHQAHIYKHEGRTWIEIDQCMLASFEEMEEIVDGKHTFEDMAEGFEKRHALELGTTS
jgi:hypothetical protein